jgi:hypothetical protein
MPDPVIYSVAAAVAGKATEMAVQGGQGACSALVRLVRERFSRDKEAAAALETARRSPQEQAVVAGLALALERVIVADAGFGPRSGSCGLG